jgi:hypothetical protein
MADRAIVLQNASMTARSVRHRHTTLLAVLSLTALWTGEAQACLGGDAASVLEDAGELHGTMQQSALARYEVEEITSNNGMLVREFRGRDGRVFAVSWAGPAMPDLQRLLGAQFATYTSVLAARDHPGLHRSARVATPDLVVESDGHLRAFTGRAYLPTKLPAGVSPAELH